MHGNFHVNPVIHRSASSGAVDRCQKAFQVTPFYPNTFQNAPLTIHFSGNRFMSPNSHKIKYMKLLRTSINSKVIISLSSILWYFLFCGRSARTADVRIQKIGTAINARLTPILRTTQDINMLKADRGVFQTGYRTSKRTEV